jgi:hypothetical protein
LDSSIQAQMVAIHPLIAGNSKTMMMLLSDHMQVLLLQQQHVLRYVGMGAAIAVAGAVVGYYMHRKSKPVATK